MKLYFSGVASHKEAQILQSVGIRDYLADPTDWHNVTALDESIKHAAVDSGAYRAFKAGTPMGVDAWLEQIDTLMLTTWLDESPNRLDFVTMPDVLGDHETTWERWSQLRSRRLEYLLRYEWFDQVIPVWQWGAPREHLGEMIAWAKEGQAAAVQFGFNFACIVGIGGCVPWMREKDKSALDELVEICETHGEFLHILGLNWLEAIERLAPLAKSCDTSKWIDGARYGEVILNENGHLLNYHKSAAGLSNASREELMSMCARTLNDYCNLGVRTQPAQSNRVIRQYKLNRNLTFQARTAKQAQLTRSKNQFNILISERDNIRRKEADENRRGS